MATDFPFDRPLRLGTRNSPLAIAQVKLVARALCEAHGWSEEEYIEIVSVTASGDKVLDRPLADIGGKALWTKELDGWLYEDRIDAAVHSMKDVETIRPDDLAIVAMLPRADVRDSLIGAASIDAIPRNGTFGTSSPRRSAQIKRLRPDLSITLFRGNVATRLGKLKDGVADATLLAAAGLERLDMPEIGTPVPPGTMLPAPAQGAVGIEILAGNAELQAIFAAIDDAATSDCVRAERAVLKALGGTCHSPIAALAELEGDMIRLRTEILLPDGTEYVTREERIARGNEAAALAIGQDMLAKASPALRALFEG